MSTGVAPIRTYREFIADQPVIGRLRTFARAGVLRALASLRSEPRSGSYIRFPFYHHVFDDERAEFSTQLDYMRNLGEFLSIDDAIALLSEPKPQSGRYFVLTFDDGFKNCATNAVPILLDHGAPAAFFVPTKFIGASVARDYALIQSFYDDGHLVEFLNWEDCRSMAGAGMTIGSHTVSHAHLIDLSEAEVERELAVSKAEIERELGAPCHHFCCPWGRPGLDFTFEREPRIAERVGYRSFLTTARGDDLHKTSPMGLCRDHLIAKWGTYQLRYFFGT